TSDQPPASRFSIEIPAEASASGGGVLATPYPSISPNGRYVVFAGGSAGSQRLWLRHMDSLVAQPMPGTEGVIAYPFWSPDNQFVGFFAGGKLKKVSIVGGAPQILCDADGGGGSWSYDDVILFEREGSIHRVPAAGGVSTAIRTPDK